MSCYTVFKSIEESIKEKKYITDLLMIFTQESNPHKVSIDTSGRVLDIYSEICERNQEFASWIHLMSLFPNNFERIDVDLTGIQNDHEIFLELCVNTPQLKCIIVHSYNCYNCYDVDSNGIIEFKNNRVKILTKEEAVIEFRPQSNFIFNDVNGSTIAVGADMNNVKNTMKEKN